MPFNTDQQVSDQQVSAAQHRIQTGDIFLVQAAILCPKYVCCTQGWKLFRPP
jgi:hypothetical protein